MLKSLSDAPIRANRRFNICDLATAQTPDQASAAGRQIGLLHSDLRLAPLILSDAAVQLWIESRSRDRLLTGSDFGDNNEIARLILDGAFEVKIGAAFASGADAWDVVFDGASEYCAAGRISSLSVRALQYGQSALSRNDVVLANRLYAYNRLPASPSQRRQFPGADSVRKALRIDDHGPTSLLLREFWSPAENAGWLLWTKRESDDATFGHSHKLYLSPMPEALPDIFRRCVEVLTDSVATTFKIGRDLYGLMRPDKFVAYFSSAESLSQTAEKLKTILGGVPAHGTPFTAALSEDGLLAWGMDPPRSVRASPSEGASWRHWIVRRLARALIIAQSSQHRTIEPWRFAMARLSLDGVEPETWTPLRKLWAD